MVSSNHCGRPRVTGSVVGLGGAVVGVGDDDDGSLRDRSSFHHEGGGHDAGDFVGVGSAEEEEGAAFGVTPHHVDGRVPGGVRQGREVVAQPARLGDAVARTDVVGHRVGASAIGPGRMPTGRHQTATGHAHDGHQHGGRQAEHDAPWAWISFCASPWGYWPASTPNSCCSAPTASSVLAM